MKGIILFSAIVLSVQLVQGIQILGSLTGNVEEVRVDPSIQARLREYTLNDVPDYRFQYKNTALGCGDDYIFDAQWKLPQASRYLVNVRKAFRWLFNSHNSCWNYAADSDKLTCVQQTRAASVYELRKQQIEAIQIDPNQGVAWSEYFRTNLQKCLYS